jgi:methionyl-tRNA formyltransferase
MNMSKNKLSIVFMGTPHFSAHILEHLIHTDHSIVGVVTVADKAAGRGKKIQVSPVKTVALEHKLTLLQPTNLKDLDFVKSLKSLAADVFVIVAFRMLPEVVWSMPKKGTFNLHASLLPQYRGAAPINWSIINGETSTGVTTFFIDQKIDTGAIIAQTITPIGKEDTAGDLHDTLMVSGARLVVATLLMIENKKPTTTLQVENTTLRDAPKIYKDDCQINWNLNGSDIYNFIRGMSPHPTAWTTLFNQEQTIVIKVIGAFFEKTNHHFNIGLIIKSKKEFKVATHDGYIHFTKIQLPGKRVMEIYEVLNGFHLKENAYIL